MSVCVRTTVLVLMRLCFFSWRSARLRSARVFFCVAFIGFGSPCGDVWVLLKNLYDLVVPVYDSVLLSVTVSCGCP